MPQVSQNPNSIMNTALIDVVLPTIEYALGGGAKSVALCSHLGRPIGEKIESSPWRQWLRWSGKAQQACATEERRRQSEVEAAFAAPAPGKVIPQENSRLYTDEESRGKAADGIERQRCLRHRRPCPQFHSEQWLHK